MKRSLVFLLAHNFRGGPRATFSHNGESNEKMPEMHLVSLQCFNKRVESPESKARYCQFSSPTLQKLSCESSLCTFMLLGFILYIQMRFL